MKVTYQLHSKVALPLVSIG